MKISRIEVDNFRSIKKYDFEVSDFNVFVGQNNHGKTNWYFAHPYHSWERGTNENTNGLIRWYFPKGTDFGKIPDETIRAVENALNNRPRKRLGWLTPLEAFNESVALQY